MKSTISFYFLAIKFVFIPSPSIHIQQSAVYQCYVYELSADDSISVQWDVNGISSASPAFQQDIIKGLGIIVDGVGTQNSSLTVPAEDVSLNETEIKCIASGFINDDVLYTNTGSSILYIQGMCIANDKYV